MLSNHQEILWEIAYENLADHRLGLFHLKELIKKLPPDYKEEVAARAARFAEEKIPQVNRGIYILDKVTDVIKNTLLMKAADVGAIDTVKLLLEYKVSIHIKNKEGQNAIDHAVKSHKYEITVLLLEQGAECDYNLIDKLDFPFFIEKIAIRFNLIHQPDRHGKTLIEYTYPWNKNLLDCARSLYNLQAKLNIDSLVEVLYYDKRYLRFLSWLNFLLELPVNYSPKNLEDIFAKIKSLYFHVNTLSTVYQYDCFLKNYPDLNEKCLALLDLLFKHKDPASIFLDNINNFDELNFDYVKSLTKNGVGLTEAFFRKFLENVSGLRSVTQQQWIYLMLDAKVDVYFEWKGHSLLSRASAIDNKEIKEQTVARVHDAISHVNEAKADVVFEKDIDYLPRDLKKIIKNYLYTPGEGYSLFSPAPEKLPPVEEKKSLFGKFRRGK